jgi:hypothetical protein
MSAAVALAETLERLDGESWGEYLAELKWLDSLATADPVEKRDAFYEDHPGNPLGKGFPLGSTLRLDGESHLQAWGRIVKYGDPCSYCGEFKAEMTLDHIVPKSTRVRGVHSWANFASACGRCNRRKADKKLLAFLLERLAVE